MRPGSIRLFLPLPAASAAFLWLVCALPAYAFDPATDHTCVAYCDTLTFEIDREVVWVPGPPIIIWKQPSTAGSRQSNFAPVDNAAMQRAINDWSQTTLSLTRKAKIAMAKGDYITAETYLNAALNRHPPANEIDDIEEALQIVRQRQMFDGSRGPGGEIKIDKFSKTEVREIQPGDLPPQLFDARRKDLNPLRKEIGPLLLERYKAEDALKKIRSSGGQPAEVEKAEQVLQTAKGAVQKKIEDNKDLITRVRLD